MPPTPVFGKHYKSQKTYTESSSFTVLRKKNNVYVDKTRLLPELVVEDRFLFFSRPKRFGKSLLISTIAALFTENAKEDLFYGMHVYAEWQPFWRARPVIQLDFSNLDSKGSKTIEARLLQRVLSVFDMYNIALNPNCLESDDAIVALVEALYNRDVAANPTSQDAGVVILIDEYDAPLTKVLLDGSDTEQKSCLNTIGAFFTALKRVNHCIRFMFVTGASKFAKAALFSGPNNLRDITYSHKFNELCGFTWEEIAATFDPQLKQLAEYYGTSIEILHQHIKAFYNGYTWSYKSRQRTIYNPWSIMSFFNLGDFEYYWADVGVPGWFVKYIANQVAISVALTSEPVNLNTTREYQLSSHIDSGHLADILMQAGFLTIDPTKTTHTSAAMLMLPNVEARSLYTKAIQALVQNATLAEKSILSIWKALDSGNVKLFAEEVHHFFCSIPYSASKPIIPKNEAFYHGILHTALSCALIESRVLVSEAETSNGRADIIVRTRSGLAYILKIKVVPNADKEEKIASVALQLVEEKNYIHHSLLRGISMDKVQVLALVFCSNIRSLGIVVSKRGGVEWKHQKHQKQVKE